MVNSNFLALAAIIGRTNAAIQSLYGQCGGQGYSGPNTCTAGSFCSTQNSYYAQCTPGGGGGGAPSPTAAAASQSLYGQCGGQGYTGPTSCTAGSFCSTQNSYYAQCTPGGGGSPPPGTTVATTAVNTAQPSSTPPASGTTYKASFTHYGQGDSYGSPNCNTDTAACGFYDYPGYNAAVSQNLYGTGPGGGAGPACGTCYQLTPQTDSSGNALHGASTIIVKVNNLCPAQGNPLCAQNGLSGTNQYGANVNFDLCQDDGAAAALFGSSGVGLALGTATQVSCSLYSGTQH